MILSKIRDVGKNNRIELKEKFNRSYFSGWQPTFIAGLKIWLDASHVVKNGSDLVSQWTDLSGFGYHALQNIDIKKPLWVNLISNGQPILRFDGADDFLKITFGLTLAQPMTYFIVWKDTNSVANPDVVIDGIDSTNRNAFYYPTANNISSYAGAGLNYAKARPHTAFICSTIVFSGLNSYIYENKVSKVNGNAGTASVTGLVIGDDYQMNGSQPFKGDIAEIIAYNVALSLTNKEKIENYLMTKYGL